MKKSIFALVACVVSAVSAAQLFNGHDLSDWVSVADHGVTGGYTAEEPTWSVVDGAIRSTGTPFGYLRTKRADFGDFKLRVEYRWWRKTAKPNSGVFVRLARENACFLPTCYENQLCMGSAGDLLGLGGAEIEGVKPAKPYDPTKALSGISKVLAAQPSPEKPFGEWNVLEVEAKGDQIVNRVNGVVRNTVKGLKVLKGAIALQSEGGAVEFRNLTIEE